MAAAMIEMVMNGVGREGICDCCEVAAQRRGIAGGVACECRANRGAKA